MKNFKKVALAATVTAMLGGFASTANAVNWLMLQGTERNGQAPRAKVWGFLQPTYQQDTSKKGAEPTRIGPNLEKQSQFQLQRARLGVRGMNMPLDSNVNYFVLAEFGQNAITDGGAFGQKQGAKLTDASVTLNHIPGARIRMGLFKTPGPEEIFQGLMTFDYINMTDVSNQMMMERFTNGVKPTCAAHSVPTSDTDPTLVTKTTATTPGACADGAGPLAPNEASWGSFGAARDIGIQVFDSFKTTGWDHSYAVMLGNGNGINTGGTADGEDTYLYWSSEMLMKGGKGPWAHGLKMFLWSHSGKRKVDLTDDATANAISYERNRTGLGMRLRTGNWRVGVEYMQGKGMIFQGPEKPNFGIGAIPATQDLKGESNGYYLDVGYYIPGTKWELDARYDVYNRSTTHQWLTAEFNTMTVGVQYHLNRKTKLTLNYATRNAKATDPIAPAGGLKKMTTALHGGLAGIEDRISLQATVLF